MAPHPPNTRSPNTCSIFPVCGNFMSFPPFPLTY
nr:MAG TPA: hypothetical protein [Caudoviricetes sp.]